MTYYGRPTWRGAAPHQFECDECSSISPRGEECWYCLEQGEASREGQEVEAALCPSVDNLLKQ